MPDFMAHVSCAIHQVLRVMHDGAPAHFSLNARKFLGRWIARGGPISWPSYDSLRSPEGAMYELNIIRLAVSVFS
jgi:hypothetical protein